MASALTAASALLKRIVEESSAFAENADGSVSLFEIFGGKTISAGDIWATILLDPQKPTSFVRDGAGAGIGEFSVSNNLTIYIFQAVAARTSDTDLAFIDLVGATAKTICDDAEALLVQRVATGEVGIAETSDPLQYRGELQVTIECP